MEQEELKQEPVECTEKEEKTAKKKCGSKKLQEELDKALDEYCSRHRRFGKVK